MANHERYFPTGVPDGATIPTDWFERVDAALSTLPNATDGSTHLGSIELGGIQAPHITKKQYDFATIAAPGPVTYTLDADVYNQWKITQGAVAADQTVTLQFENLRAGDEIVVAVTKGSDGDLYDLTLQWSWTGAGLEVLHVHAEGCDQVDQAALGSAMTVWRGSVVLSESLATVFWHVVARI
jgi:hypothetical protein